MKIFRVNSVVLYFMLSLLLYPADGRAAIQYTGFGPATVSFSNAYVPVPNFFGGTIAFGWHAPAGPARREGFMEVGTNTTATFSFLTDGSDISILSQDSVINASTPGTWNPTDTFQILYSRVNSSGVYNSSLLSPSEIGVVGLRVSYLGDFYYGWIEISNIAADGASYQVSGLLYNDTPNASVLAGSQVDPNSPPPPPPSAAIPEPASVGLILLGAAGLTMLRRRDD
jgi:hypothetical protein